MIGVYLPNDYSIPQNVKVVHFSIFIGHNRLVPSLSHLPNSPFYNSYTIPNGKTLYLWPGDMLEVYGTTISNANVKAYPGSKIV